MAATSSETRILIVDDDKEQLHALIVALEMHGYVVYGTSDGRRAMVLLDELRHTAGSKILITDLEMPAMSGSDLITLASQVCADLVVVVITGVGNRELKERLWRRGIHHYLDKPFDVNTLMAKIQALETTSRLTSR